MLPDEAGSARDAVQVHMFMDDYTLWYSKGKHSSLPYKAHNPTQ